MRGHNPSSHATKTTKFFLAMQIGQFSTHGGKNAPVPLSLPQIAMAYYGKPFTTRQIPPPATAPPFSRRHRAAAFPAPARTGKIRLDIQAKIRRRKYWQTPELPAFHPRLDSCAITVKIGSGLFRLPVPSAGPHGRCCPQVHSACNSARFNAACRLLADGVFLQRQGARRAAGTT